MIGIKRSEKAALPARAGLGDLLGLSAADHPAIVKARTARLAEAAALWPLALGMLVLAPAGLVALAALGGGAPLAVAVRALPAIAAGLLGLVLFMAPGAEGWSSRLRIMLLTAAAMAAGASLPQLLVSAAGLASPDARLVGFVAICGTIMSVVIAVAPVRAALLGFAAALAVSTMTTATTGLATVAAAILAAAFALGVIRLARGEHAALGARAAAEQAGRVALRLVREYEAQGSGWFWQADRTGTLTYLSAKVAQEIAAMGIEPVGARLTDVFRVDGERVDTERTLAFHLSSRTSFLDYSVRPGPERAPERWWSISGRPMLDEFGRFEGFSGWGSDLTARRRADAEITRLALFDSLTGLANRQRMRLTLDQTLQGMGQGTGRGATALLLLDLDRFKAVNDTLGHQKGDALLKQVAQRLTRTVGEAGLVGRLGGDEFQVILPREGGRDALADLARGIIAALSQPYFIEGSNLSIGCSIGIAISPDHGTDAETLVRNADLALYAAKADGRGVHRFYREELLAGAQSRKQLEDDLRFALRNDQFHLTYQPVVSTATARIVGYEALLRWDHPTRGSISPTEFIPVAEDFGFIEEIGAWVLRTACREAARWPEGVRVAVNVSPIQFANPALPAIVTNAIAAAGIAPARLELEITEGVFLDETASADAMFKALKGIGVRLALDDFGTGYSSLGYLKSAPFDKIKIDQSFVRGAIQPGNRNAAIIKAIVTLADTLGMETTAEGVEQQDEIGLIRELGCSHIQGFVYGRPARAEDVRAQLAAGGGSAMVIGHKVSRSPRLSTLRSARVEFGTQVREARIRNISSSGAMIDGVDLPAEAVGVDLLIELIEDQLFAATVRWAEDGKAGLEFSESFNLERLNQPVVRRLRRGAM